MDICLWVLKESNKSRFDSYSVRNSVLIISHITFRNCRVPIFSDNLSRHNCVHGRLRWKCDWFNRRWIAVSSCRTRALMERNDLVFPPITYLYFYGNDVTYQHHSVENNCTLSPERGECRNTFANVLPSDYDRILGPKGNYRVTSTSGSLLIPGQVKAPHATLKNSWVYQQRIAILAYQTYKSEKDTLLWRMLLCFCVSPRWSRSKLNKTPVHNDPILLHSNLASNLAILITNNYQNNWKT